MASRLLKVGAVVCGPSRGLSAQAAVAPAAEFGVLPREPLRTSTLKNGLLVASVETQAPLCRVAVAFRGGARYEAPEQRGATHLLRVSAGLTNHSDSKFLLVNKLQQLGSALSCSVDREMVVYAVQMTRNQTDDALQLLAGAATRHRFFPWEVQDIKPSVLLDSQLASPHAALLDDLHYAAFRETGLGHALYTTPERLVPLDADALGAHVSRTLQASRAAVLGVGVDHAQLCQYAEQLQLAGGGGQAERLAGGAGAGQRVAGGEQRTEYGGPLTLVAVAGAGPSASEPAELAVHAVLQALLGGGTAVKYGAGSGLLGAIASQHGAAANGLGAVYSDAGLSGYCLMAPAESAGEALRAVHKAFKSTGLTAEHLARGKAMARASLMHGEWNTAGLLDSMAQQAILTGAVVKAGHALKAIDAVTLSQLQTAMKTLSTGKLAMASRGCIRGVPYLDEL